VAKGDDIEDRLIVFAVTIINLCNRLPDTPAGRHIAGQLRICLKELNESRVWLKISGMSKILPREEIAPVYKECDELCRIINASVRTAQAH
jgi:hypothetical protein